MAERYLKSIDKVLNKSLVYLKLNRNFYRIKRIEMKNLHAKFLCKQIENGRDYEIKFKTSPDMFSDLVTFGLKDKKHGIFVILTESNELSWFETTIEELIKQIDEREIREGIRRELEAYDDMEEHHS